MSTRSPGVTNEHDVIEVLPFDLVHHVIDILVVDGTLA